MSDDRVSGGGVAGHDGVGPDDERLLTRLGAVAARVDGPPDIAFELGRSALAWRTVDADLAQLVADSALETAGVRAAASDIRLLSFETDDLVVEVQVSGRADGRSVLGQVIPAPGDPDGVVHVESDTGATSPAPLDTLGRFEVADLPGGRLRLRIERPGAATVTTVWVHL